MKNYEEQVDKDSQYDSKSSTNIIQPNMTL